MFVLSITEWSIMFLNQSNILLEPYSTATASPIKRAEKSAFYQPLLSVTLQAISKGVQSLHLFPSYVQKLRQSHQ